MELLRMLFAVAVCSAIGVWLIVLGVLLRWAAQMSGN